MLICGECGAHNEKGENFCGECGAYLDWTAQQVEVPQPPPVDDRPEPEPGPEPEPEPQPEPAGFADRIRVAVGISAAPPVEEAGAASEARRDDRGLAAGQGNENETAGRRADSAIDDDEPSPADPIARQPREGEVPIPVRPGPPAPPRRRSQRRMAEHVAPGDVVCGQCGAGNKPSRKFCRRCGADLVDAPVARLPWWRRLLPRRSTPLAGARPRRRRRRGRVTRSLVMVAVVAVLAALLWQGRGLAGSAFQAVLDRVIGTQIVNPAVLRASSSLPGAGASQARDGLTNRFWAPGQAGAARGAFLQAQFAEPIRLVYVVVHGGVAEDEDLFLRHGRPRELQVVLLDSEGSRKTEGITMEDRPGPQQFHVGTSDVVALQLVIVSSRPGSRPGSPVAIAEVEFHGRG